MSEDKKPLSFAEKLRLKNQNQVNYGGATEMKAASMVALDCPNCGAGRAKQDGLTHCAYCSFEFLAVKLSDGLHLKKGDNSAQ